eukprot:5867009-Prymnesium_polylepis.2
MRSRAEIGVVRVERVSDSRLVRDCTDSGTRERLCTIQTAVVCWSVGARPFEARAPSIHIRRSCHPHSPTHTIR